jgi:four helix bundle protein
VVKIIKTHRELEVYNLSFDLAMEIFNITKSYPPEEKYSLIDQIRRSSRSVCANLAEAFRKRGYPKAFISKLSDSETEATETQTWLEFSLSCKYISKEQFDYFNNSYNNVIGKLVVMINQPEKWAI